MSTQDLCIHCGLEIPPAELVIDQINGEECRFCCRGCQGVYRIITGAGLNRFYQQRNWTEVGVPDGVFEAKFNDLELSGHVERHSPTSASISLLIEGIRCASCVWLLEKLLVKETGINAFRLNYGTHRAQLAFNPLETSPGKIFAAISRLGYLPRPFTSGAAQIAAAREQKSLLIRFGTAAFLTMQLMGFSFALYGGYFHGIDPEARTIMQCFAAAVTTPVVFYSGWPFLTGAWRSIKNRAPSMDLLISLGVLSAYSYSLYALFNADEVYFDTAAMIITLILLGRLFEGSARHLSISGIDKLLQLAPESANLLDDEEMRVVSSASLVPGNLILIRPGERIPVDGRIVSGQTEFDESTITGEPLPILRQQGESVSAGSLNISSSIRLCVEKVASESFIARMARLVEEAQNRKAPIQSLADRVASLFVPAVTLIALVSGGFWLFAVGDPAVALLNLVSVLIVACPCALGLATPTAVLVASGSAASRGILFRGGDILEMTGQIKVMAFDKTGTLTVGKATVEKIITAPGISEEEVLQLACQLESGANHPIAHGILARAKSAGIETKLIESVETIPGKGLRATIGKQQILVGSFNFLRDHGVEIPILETGNLSEVYISRGKLWYGTLLIHDPLRAEAVAAMEKLQQLGLQTVLLTGDRTEAATLIGNRLGVTECQANLSPADKAAWITARKRSGEKIMMIGDGINDAPALSTADIGCAMAGGTDIALETSDLVLTRPNLGRLGEAVYISRKTVQIIKQNLFWAFAYNFITIPLAACGLLEPVWAALAMASSSILVIGNSLRLGRILKQAFPVAKSIAER